MERKECPSTNQREWRQFESVSTNNTYSPLKVEGRECTVIYAQREKPDLRTTDGTSIPYEKGKYHTKTRKMSGLEWIASIGLALTGLFALYPLHWLGPLVPIGAAYLGARSFMHMIETPLIKSIPSILIGGWLIRVAVDYNLSAATYLGLSVVLGIHVAYIATAILALTFAALAYGFVHERRIKI
jgi:hypothetical protein